MASCRKCGAFVDAGARFCKCCGESLFVVTAPHLPEWEAALGGSAAIAGPSVPPKSAEPAPKSLAMAVLLAGLFGPLGMVYSTLSGALVMLLISLSLLLASGEDLALGNLYSLLIAWPVCVVWSAIAAEAWNEERR